MNTKIQTNLYQSHRAKFAELVRKLILISIKTNTSEDKWAALNQAIGQIIDKFENEQTSERNEGDQKSNPLYAYHMTSTVSGIFNPIAPPIQITTSEDITIGETRYDVRYEGAPGCLHGGHIALAIDHIAGFVASNIGPVLTGKLNIRYLRPTRLHRTIRYQARLREKHSRMIIIDCDAYDQDLKTASAEVIFMLMSPQRIAEVIGIMA